MGATACSRFKFLVMHYVNQFHDIAIGCGNPGQDATGTGQISGLSGLFEDVCQLPHHPRPPRTPSILPPSLRRLPTVPHSNLQCLVCQHLVCAVRGNEESDAVRSREDASSIQENSDYIVEKVGLRLFCRCSFARLLAIQDDCVVSSSCNCGGVSV